MILKGYKHFLENKLAVEALTQETLGLPIKLLQGYLKDDVYATSLANELGDLKH
jgi:hypothetical protein